MANIQKFSGLLSSAASTIISTDKNAWSDHDPKGGMQHMGRKQTGRKQEDNKDYPSPSATGKKGHLSVSAGCSAGRACELSSQPAFLSRRLFESWSIQVRDVCAFSAYSISSRALAVFP